MWYYIYSLITAPGVMAHECSHLIFCWLSGVKVHKVKLFQFGHVAGYVVHDEPQKFNQGFAIAFGPIIINTLAALVLFSQVEAPWNRAWPFVAAWLGITFGLHAIPSDGDALTLWQLFKHRFKKNPLIIIGLPFIPFLYLLNFLKRLHIDWLFTALLFWLGAIYLKK